MGEVVRNFWMSSCPTPIAQAGPPEASWPGLGPGNFLISPGCEITQTLWAIYSRGQ